MEQPTLEQLQKVEILNRMYGDLLKGNAANPDDGPGWWPWYVWAHTQDKEDEEFSKLEAYVEESISEFISFSNALPCIGFRIPVNEHIPERKTLWQIMDINVELADRSLTTHPKIALEFIVQKL